jgi:hypothetical protein
VDALVLQNPELVHTADRLDELAQKAGLPTDKFLATVVEFNRDLQNGTDLKFNLFNSQNPPTARLGRPAIPPIAVPPFYAIPVFAMTRKSLGGVAVDLECQVLNQRREPIPNLYAAGEVTGFNGLNGKAGLEGTFLGPSILQGRILGQILGKRAHAGAVSAALPQVRESKTSEPAGTPCQSCHPMRELVATPRKGYWHFERVHKLVLDRGSECQVCRAELWPFHAKQHRTDALVQIAACAGCHLSGK